MTSVSESGPSPDLTSLIGTWRRFGVAGPVYEIVGFDHRMQDGGWMMCICVVKSGEETAYKLADLMDDPEET